MKKIHKILLFLFLIFFNILSYSYEIDSFGIVKPTSPPRLVNDFANMLTTEQVTELENDLVAYHDSTSTQIAIVIIDTLNGMEIDAYALQLGRTWGIGQKDKNNGVLLLISKNDRKVDIEVGYGLEAHLTDYGCRAIINNSIVPNFKAEKYYQGIHSAIYSIKHFIQEYPSMANYASTTIREESFWDKYAGYLAIIIAILPTLIAFIIGWRYGGSSTYSSSGWTSSSSSNYTSTTSNYSGSSRSSSGSSGNSFSGYGGGSFGGGGSSGSW